MDLTAPPSPRPAVDARSPRRPHPLRVLHATAWPPTFRRDARRHPAALRGNRSRRSRDHAPRLPDLLRPTSTDPNSNLNSAVQHSIMFRAAPQRSLLCRRLHIEPGEIHCPDHLIQRKPCALLSFIAAGTPARLTAPIALRSMHGICTSPPIGSHVMPRLWLHADLRRVLHLVVRPAQRPRPAARRHRAPTPLALASNFRPADRRVLLVQNADRRRREKYRRMLPHPAREMKIPVITEPPLEPPPPLHSSAQSPPPPAAFSSSRHRVHRHPVPAAPADPQNPSHAVSLRQRMARHRTPARRKRIPSVTMPRRCTPASPQYQNAGAHILRLPQRGLIASITFQIGRPALGHAQQLCPLENEYASPTPVGTPLGAASSPSARKNPPPIEK